LDAGSLVLGNLHPGARDRGIFDRNKVGDLFLQLSDVVGRGGSAIIGLLGLQLEELAD
jgi:hypothetical protein